MLPTGQLVEHLSIAKVKSYSAKGAGLGVGGVSPPTGGGGGGGRENFSFDNTLKVDFRLSGVHK